MTFWLPLCCTYSHNSYLWILRKNSFHHHCFKFVCTHISELLMLTKWSRVRTYRFCTIRTITAWANCALLIKHAQFSYGVRCFATQLYFPAILSGENNFYNFLFAFLDNKTLPKRDLFLTLLHSEGPVVLSTIGYMKIKTPREVDS